MKKHIAFVASLFVAFASQAAYVRQATEEYPSGGGGGGVTTNAVKTIVNAEVGGTNTLVHTPQIADFVTKAVTNGLATQTWVEGKQYVTKAVTNGLVSADRATAIADSEIVAKGAVLTNASGRIEGRPGGIFNWLTIDGANTESGLIITDISRNPGANITINSIRSYHDGGKTRLYFPWFETSGNRKDVLAVKGNITNVTDDTVLSWGYVKSSVTNGLVTAAVTNGLASEAWVNAKKYVTDAVTNGILVAANTYADQYANQAPDYANVSNKAVTALQTHQSLAWSNEYRRVDAKVDWADVTNHADFVTEIVTNGLVTASITNGLVTAAITNDLVTASVTNGLATTVAATNIAYAVVTNAVNSGYVATRAQLNNTKNQLDTRINQVTNRVGQVEAYLGGQNVRVSVTNVNGSAMGDLPKLRIETNVSNVWNVVWDEDTKYGTWYTNATSAVAAMTNSVRHDVNTFVTNAVASKAPLAWGTVTSAGGPAPANTVWHTAGKTVFGGGTEFQLVAVGTGQIGVLVNKGSVVYAEGNPGTFFFETEDFRYHFGMRVEDSYMLGCNTDGITVTQVAGGNLVTLTYNVTMTGKPCLYYKASLATTNAWEKLNDSTGTPIPGASKVISWEATPPAGKEICYIPCGTDGQGFFTACVEVAGKQTFETNLAIDPQGGILATNETLNVMTAIEPYIIGGEVKWRIKP